MGPRIRQHARVFQLILPFQLDLPFEAAGLATSRAGQARSGGSATRTPRAKRGRSERPLLSLSLELPIFSRAVLSPELPIESEV